MDSSEEKRVWGIHTLNDTLFLNENLIAIGWKEMGNLKQIEGTREVIKERYNKAYPDSKKGAVANGVGMLYRFVYDVRIGDYVVFPSKIDRQINIGIIESDYIYNPNTTEYVQQRKVKWLKHLPRTSFSQGALYEVGSAMSFFAVKNYADEYLSALDKAYKTAVIPPDDESVGATAEDIIET